MIKSIIEALRLEERQELLDEALHLIRLHLPSKVGEAERLHVEGDLDSLQKMYVEGFKTQFL